MRREGHGLRGVSRCVARKADTQGSWRVHRQQSWTVPAGKGRRPGIRAALRRRLQPCSLCICSFSCLHPHHPSQAIRELQEEVSRLQLRLEDSLHQHLQGSPKRPASNFDHPTRARDQPADSSATWGSHYGRWVNPKLPPLCPGGSCRGSGWPTSGSPQTCGLRHSHIPLSLIHSFIHSYIFFLPCDI